MSNCDAPRIEFPCDYPVKIVGDATADFRSLVEDIVERHAAGFARARTTERFSANSRFVSVTVTIVGTSIGVPGAIPPLVVGATPFFARLVENVLREVDRGIIEASQSMGASLSQTIFGAVLPEAFPGLLAATTVTAIALVSYAAMSGVIGGGGLGDLAIRFGYQRFQTDVMFVTVAILLVLVQLIQAFGDRLVHRFTRS